MNRSNKKYRRYIFNVLFPLINCCVLKTKIFVCFDKLCSVTNVKGLDLKLLFFCVEIAREEENYVSISVSLFRFKTTFRKRLFDDVRQNYLKISSVRTAKKYIKTKAKLLWQIQHEKKFSKKAFILGEGRGKWKRKKTTRFYTKIISLLFCKKNRAFALKLEHKSHWQQSQCTTWVPVTMMSAIRI